MSQPTTKQFAKMMEGKTEYYTKSSTFDLRLWLEPTGKWHWTITEPRGLNDYQRGFGKAKTCVHAYKNAVKKAKEVQKKDEEDERRSRMDPNHPQFDNHPIIVAAQAKFKASIAAGVSWLEAHEVRMRETGTYYWRTGTQFVPGMGPYHYGDEVRDANGKLL